MTKSVAFVDLGLVDYKQAWDFQQKLFDATVAIKAANYNAPVGEAQPTQNHLIFCEHPHVYTLGKSGDAANLLLPEARLSEIGATYYHINRGGDITYHGPGQLVVYPILDLDHFKADIHWFMRTMEEAVIQTLAHFHIKATRIEKLTGVWLENPPRKICAMGVKMSRWVTMHGLALNVNPTLNYFTNIVPCGIQDKAVTSMQQELGEVRMEEVKAILKAQLAQQFSFSWQP